MNNVWPVLFCNFHKFILATHEWILKRSMHDQNEICYCPIFRTPNMSVDVFVLPLSVKWIELGKAQSIAKGTDELTR